ncbi:MAG: GFA family protein [Xenococcaceae cyanobacterium MO_188.B32]|nr:GFA family protein [Xenococcaceae cyanobacterium MO_188.B32]
MSELSIIKGSCLCGAVNVSTTSTNNKVGACHCSMCRKWGGGALLVIECGSDVSFEGEENIGIYQSSEWAERGFRKKCGSHLFYKFKQKNQYYIPVATRISLKEKKAFSLSRIQVKLISYVVFAQFFSKLSLDFDDGDDTK